MSNSDYRICLYRGDVKLVFKTKGGIRLEPAVARKMGEELIAWAKAADQTNDARAAVAARKDVRTGRFYRTKKTWTEQKQEEEKIRKEVEGMEHCSNCGELFMNSFSCSIYHGTIKHQKALVKKWDERDKKVEKVLLDNEDFEAWQGEPVNIGWNDPMEGL